jgi:hypothetical protein
MTNKATESGEYFEFSKVTRPPLLKASIVLILALTVCVGGYVDGSWGNNTLIVAAYFTVSVLADYSGINFKDTPHLKAWLLGLSFGLAAVALVLVALATKSGRIYDHIQWLIN